MQETLALAVVPALALAVCAVALIYANHWRRKAKAYQAEYLSLYNARVPEIVNGLAVRMMQQGLELDEQQARAESGLFERVNNAIEEGYQ